MFYTKEENMRAVKYRKKREKEGLFKPVFPMIGMQQVGENSDVKQGVNKNTRTTGCFIVFHRVYQVNCRCPRPCYAEHLGSSKDQKSPIFTDDVQGDAKAAFKCTLVFKRSADAAGLAKTGRREDRGEKGQGAQWATFGWQTGKIVFSSPPKTRHRGLWATWL